MHDVCLGCSIGVLGGFWFSYTPLENSSQELRPSGIIIPETDSQRRELASGIRRFWLAVDFLGQKGKKYAQKARTLVVGISSKYLTLDRSVALTVYILTRIMKQCLDDDHRINFARLTYSYSRTTPIFPCLSLSLSLWVYTFKN